MNHQQTSLRLAKLAEILREEGDTVTADAIKRQLDQRATRALSEEQRERLRAILTRAKGHDRAGHYDAAAVVYAEALQIAEGALGAFHPEIIDLLADEARCRLNSGQYDLAVAGYSRVRRLVLDLHGDDDPLVRGR
jgi:multidrug efflux pump subunit AcrA (membrane-fusion protein)